MIIAELANIDIEILGVISFICAIAFLSLSVVLLYQIMMKSNKDTKNKVITILVSYIIIFNYLMIEHIYFLESCIMSLGVLLSVYACKIIIQDRKYCYTKAYLLLLVAVFCYQGSIAIFPMIVLTYYVIIDKFDIKSYIKLIIKIMLMYGSLMLLNILFVKLIFGGSRIQIGATSVNIADIAITAKNLVVNSLNVILPYMHILIIAITVIILAVLKNSYKDKMIAITKYLIIVIIAIAICLMPTLTGSGIEIEPRTSIAFGATIGIGFWFMLSMLEENDNKVLKWMVFSIICIASVLNIALYFVLTHQHIQINKLDKEIFNKVSDKIIQYEAQNDTKVTKIAVLYDKNKKEYEDGTIKTPAYNLRGAASWAVPNAIQMYAKRDLQRIVPEKEIYLLFKAKDWDEFSEEQIYILGDTLYFCVY